MDGLPWDAAALADLDFAEQLLVYTEDEPDKAAADAARLQAEQLEIAQYQDSLVSALGQSSKAPSTANGKRPYDSTDGPGPSGTGKAPGSVKEDALGDSAANKACREKARRCRLNDRFSELAMLLEEPGQGPKTDKASILIAAISTVTNLRREIGQLRQLNKYLEERVGHYEKESSRQMYQQVVAFAHAGQPGGVLPSGSSVPVHMHGNGPASGMMQAAMQGGMMSAAMQASTAHAAMPHGTVIHFVQAPGEASALRPHHHHANLHPFQAMHPQIPTSMPKAHMVALAPAGSYSYLPGAMDPSQDASLRPPVA